MGKIIDVSSNNGSIDWNEVANDGVTDAIIRLSLGFGDNDKLAEKYATEATRSGIRVSYYHLAYPDKRNDSVADDATQEANYFTSLFLFDRLPAPKMLAIDLEKMANGWDTKLTKSEYLQWLSTFLSVVYASTGIVCMIYSNRPYLDLHLPANHKLGSIPLWISNYNNVNTPPLPVGWTNYFLWQFTDVGKVKGIKGFVDMNRTGHDILFEKLSRSLLSKTKFRKLTNKEIAVKTALSKLSLADVKTKVQANNKSSFSKELVVSICWAESSFDPAATATGSTSKGLMMMNKGAVDTVNANTPSGVHFEYDDMLNADKAIEAGTWYLKILYTKPDWGCQGDIRKTLKQFRGAGDFVYADKIIACESCLQTSPVADHQKCLNNIHP